MFIAIAQIFKIKTLREATECSRKNEPAVLDEQSHKNLELHVFTSSQIINSLVILKGGTNDSYHFCRNISAEEK